MVIGTCGTREEPLALLLLLNVDVLVNRNHGQLNMMWRVTWCLTIAADLAQQFGQQDQSIW